MMRSLNRVLVIGLALLLSGCITEYSPEDKTVQLKSGESQTFEVTSNNPHATLIWYLDGEEVASDTAQYTYTAEQNATGEAINHRLMVKEDMGEIGKDHRKRSIIKKKRSKGKDSVTWDICILPDPSETYTYYLDSDKDGYGDPNDSVTSAEPQAPEGYADNSGDCNDANAAIHPGAAEVCDHEDNNCNGEIDEGDVCTTYTYYKDADGDGYGNPNDSVTSAEPQAPEGYVDTSGDCKDDDAAINPGATEVCDQTDNNCNGEIDEGDVCTEYTYYKDADGDGYGDPNDSVTSAEPQAPEGYAYNIYA
jgi:hypothetical protein